MLIRDYYIAGGGWSNAASILCASIRDGRDPSYRFGILGFRLVRRCE